MSDRSLTAHALRRGSHRGGDLQAAVDELLELAEHRAFPLEEARARIARAEQRRRSAAGTRALALLRMAHRLVNDG